MSAPVGLGPALDRRRFLAWIGAVAVTVAGGCEPGGEIDRVSWLNWQDYVDRGLLRRFTATTGIAVTYETYASNDELLRRLTQARRPRRGGRRSVRGFDLAVPSDNALVRMVTEGFVQRLRRHELDLSVLDPALRRAPFDPGNRHSVPWATGTTGLGYDRERIGAPPGYEVFDDPGIAQRASVLAERRDAFAAALFSLGLDPNTRRPRDIDEAARKLVAWKRNGVVFDSARYLDRLAAGELLVAQGYSSDVLQARRRNPAVAYTLPAEGALRWVDCLCVLDGARNPGGAHRFIAFFLEPRRSARNSLTIGADTGNRAARGLLPVRFRSDPAVFPPPEVAARLVFTEDLGPDEQRYARAWERVLDA
jgi:spermidine/putrescine transport system substrate-binding protein